MFGLLKGFVSASLAGADVAAGDAEACVEARTPEASAALRRNERREVLGVLFFTELTHSAYSFVVIILSATELTIAVVARNASPVSDAPSGAIQRHAVPAIGFANPLVGGLYSCRLKPALPTQAHQFDLRNTRRI